MKTGRVFLLKNYWKFDVLKTNICQRRANMLVLRTSNFSKEELSDRWFQDTIFSSAY